MKTPQEWLYFYDTDPTDSVLLVEVIQMAQKEALREGQRQGLLRAAQICRDFDCSVWDQIEITRKCAQAIEAEAQRMITASA